jgi:hypothetical protein
MAVDIKITTAGEIDLTLGKPSLVTGIDQVVQKLCIRLQIFTGSWFLDLSVGIPYFDVVLRKAVNESDILQIFFEALSNTRGVASVDELSLTFNTNRTLSIDGRVTFEDSPQSREFSDTIGSLI